MLIPLTPYHLRDDTGVVKYEDGTSEQPGVAGAGEVGGDAACWQGHVVRRQLTRRS